MGVGQTRRSSKARIGQFWISNDPTCVYFSTDESWGVINYESFDLRYEGNALEISKQASSIISFPKRFSNQANHMINHLIHRQILSGSRTVVIGHAIDEKVIEYVGNFKRFRRLKKIQRFRCEKTTIWVGTWFYRYVKF